MRRYRQDSGLGDRALWGKICPTAPLPIAVIRGNRMPYPNLVMGIPATVAAETAA